MQKHFIIALLLLSFLTMNAQPARNNQALDDPISFRKQLMGRVNFTGLLDEFDRNISLGAEYLYAPQWAAGLDAGYIFQSAYLRKHSGVRGVLLRPFARYYFTEKRYGFLEAHFHYKYAAYRVSDWIGREVNDGVPAYEEYTSFDFTKRVWGISLIIGDKFNLSKENKNVKIEPYVGLGARFKKQGTAGNASYRPDNNRFTPIYEPAYNYTGLLMGMRLTFKM